MIVKLLFPLFVCFVSVLLPGGSPLVNAQENAAAFFSRDSEDSENFSKRDKEFVAIFEPIVKEAAISTVRVMSGRRQLALGIIVDTEGHILTKASELKGNLSCKLPDGRSSSATVVGIHPETDLAMLQIHLENLVPIHWSDAPLPVVGNWVATPTSDEPALDVGIVGVSSRVIPRSSPFIGITMLDVKEKNGVKITSVISQSPADDADLLVGDTITHLDGIETNDIESLRNTLGQYDPNDRVTLSILRAGKPLKIKLTLAERDKVSPANDRSNQQNSMGSVLSRRRKDFPNAFQHDSMLNSNTCGGPIVNLDGEVVGVNIARAGRVSSLALPTATVLPVLAKLASGELSPELVNKERIAEIDAELADLNTKMESLPDRKRTLDTQYQVEKAKQEELEKILKEVQDRLKVIQLKTENFRTELDSVSRDIKNIEKVRQQLEADRKELSTGLR